MPASDSDYHFLTTYTEGEFRMWLGSRLDAGDGRINLIEEVQDRNSSLIANNEQAIQRVVTKCAANDWIGRSLKWVACTAVLQLLALLGWLIKTYVI